MRRPGLSVAAKAVYATLATYADRHGWCWLRQETIASDLGRSRSWVHAALTELEAAGLLLHDRQYLSGLQRASRYHLLDGLVRFAEPAPAVGETPEPAVSAGSDSAVQPADTNHYDDLGSSLSGRAREPEVRSVPKPVPANWVPTSDDVAWATLRHPDLDVLRFTEAFVLSCQSKDYRYCDISAAWRRWLLEPRGRLPKLTGRPVSVTLNSGDSRHDRLHRPASPVDRDSDLDDENQRRSAAVRERIMARRSVDPDARPAR
jgi:hypothetical protein